MESEKISLREVENEEEDDGPPPGFQCIISPQPAQLKKVEVIDEDEDEDDGPPPGFGPAAPTPQPPFPSSDKEMSNKQEDVDDDDDDDGPPPGWEFTSLARALPKPPSSSTDVITELNEEHVEEEDDDGPPPGWEMVLPRQMPLSSTPQVKPSSDVSSDLKMESKQDAAKNEEKEPQTVSQSTLIPEQSSSPKPPMQPPQSSTLPGERGKREVRNRVKRPTNGKHSVSAQQMPPPAPQPTGPAATSSSELAQLVCGTCRKLCTYPRGTKWVKCPSCLEVNFVMEAHEVGQVKCRGCTTLLMYPYGAPAVQCSSCLTITEIGAHNRRAPLSVQQNQRRRRPNRAR